MLGDRWRVSETLGELFAIAPSPATVVGMTSAAAERLRFTGAVYKASGWIHVGTTRGRGKHDRSREFGKPRKGIWLCPLRKDWKRTLSR